MHKLDRTAVAAPVCLANFNHPTHNWNDVGGYKREIRASLFQMQGPRCAYCEGAVYSDAHVEHFRRKRHFRHLTFDWSNLFLSCDVREHCGHYKDRPRGAGYNPDDIVKPDEEDPDDYFYFHSSGTVRPRSGLDVVKQRRASETIRVFNLDCSFLQAERRRAIKQYDRRNPEFLETLMGFDEQDRQQFIDEEIEATKNDYHWTVIRHYFEKV